jgi:PAS domain S-box-containing protein
MMDGDKKSVEPMSEKVHAMKDDNKTKKQLVHELTELRSQDAALKKSITGTIYAELAAEEARRYAESIVGTVREPLLVLDADLKIISANRTFYRTFKVTPGETIGSFIYDLGNKQWDIPKLRELLEEVLPEKEAFDDFEVSHNFQDIGHKIMLLNARQIYRKDIGAKMILLAIEDITERREIENGLEKTRKELAATKISEDEAREYAESIINTVREPLIALDHDLRVVTASRSFYEFFKVKPEETIGQLIYDLGDKQWDIPKLRELLETILPQKTTFDNYEVEHNFDDIGRRIMLLNARQIKRVFGKERIILLAIEDITERKRLESLLTDSEEQYRRLFETASDGIVLLEKREGKITHANPATEKILGYTKKDSIGNKLQDIGVLLDMRDFQTTMQNLNKSGIINYRNVKAETKSGQHIDTEIYLVDRAKLVQCNIRDITERKQAKENLRESEKRYRDLFDFLPIPVYEMDFEANIISANRAIYETFGGKEEDLKKGFKAWQLLSPEAIDKSSKNIERLLKGEKIGGTEYTLKRLDGSVFPAIVTSNVIYSNDKPVGLRGAIVDITQRKQQEEALKESENRYRLLADNVNDVIFVLDMNLNYTYISPSVKILRGYEPAEVLKRPSTETLTPSSSDLAMRTLSEFLALEKSEHGEIPISRTLDLEMIRKDGTTVWTEVKFSFIRDENQRPVGILGVTRDITKRKKAEEDLKETLESLRKAFNATIQVMVSAVESRDPYTAGHQLRSADLARSIAMEMGLSQGKIDGIRMAGSIHDIGKLSIPAEILSKPTKLTNIEFSLIKEHSKQGYEMLKDVESPWPLAEIVYQHHERMNGSGYPRNLKGDDILMEARILAVSDVVESMASHRPYRPALGIEAALEEIEKNRGTLYDTGAADVCLRLFREKGFQLEEHDFKR